MNALFLNNNFYKDKEYLDEYIIYILLYYLFNYIRKSII